MQGNTRQFPGQAAQVLLVLAVVSLLVLALVGQPPEPVAGWLVTPALLAGRLGWGVWLASAARLAAGAPHRS